MGHRCPCKVNGGGGPDSIYTPGEREAPADVGRGAPLEVSVRMSAIGKALAATVVLLVAATAPADVMAQVGEKFSVRLGWVPITPADRANVTGKGTATATLTGKTLTIAGTFEGLAAPATVARLHRGVAKGARGPVVADLVITKAASGKISGTVEMTPELLEQLRQGRLYIQVHSEKGIDQDGANLWGWLLK